MKTGLPYLSRGMRIGYFGGSFDPLHAGHMLVARRALRHLALDQIWFVPSRGNPLKSRQPSAMTARIAAIETAIHDPKLRAVDLETKFETLYTIDTIRALKARYAHVHFVMICGADILKELHRWRDWEALAHLLPICAFARPSEQLSAMSSPFAHRFRRQFVPQSRSRELAQMRAPAWSLVRGEMNDLSSSAIRESQ